MFPFELTILGCSSATPTSSRHPTAQLLNMNERFFLIDCGEATQIQLRKFKIKIQRIDRIFISHLHGDHYLGLPGLLGTMHLLGREKELHIYSPPGLEEIITISHHHSKTYLKYNIVFHSIEERSAVRLFEDDKLTVETIPMNHRIPCYGFLFCEKKRPKKIIQEKIEEYNIPLQEIPLIKNGQDFISQEGKRIPNAELTTEAPSPRSYAYCSDTIYNESYVQQIKNVNLLYHEATFTSDMSERAKDTHHCTAHEAGSIALKANVNQLIIGHYSARYRELEPLLAEAKQVFSNTLLAIEGEAYKII
ncbi:MAG: ribonuclease Z [Bacteroidetes bacterium]|nr:ribonuclease Z [Bacteroidota bacterium]